MTDFYTNIFVRGNYVYCRGYKDGQRFSHKEHYRPYVFVHKPDGVYRTVNGIQCGKFQFDSIKQAKDFTEAYKKLSTSREVFVSDVIGYCINKGKIFTVKETDNYVDVGTAPEWFEFNDKPVIFCDIDGTIIKNQGRIGKNNYLDDPIPLEKNIKRLLELQNKGEKILAQYTAAWCGPCRALTPRLSNMSNSYDKVKFVKIDVEENR